MKNISIFAFFLSAIASYGTFSATIAAGEQHSLFVDREGYVWATGGNTCGQLGLGDNVNEVKVPTKIENIPPIKAVAAGNYHSLFLDMDGNVWATGGNTYGKLGLGDKNSRKISTKIENIPPIKAVAVGIGHSLFLDTEGCVWATGNNYKGQLGLGDNDDRKILTKIKNIPPIKAVAAGNYHSLFLDVDGNVWAVGLNSSGQLGLGDNMHEVNVPTKIKELPPIVAVETGGNHSLFTDTEGYVWATGNNNFGQLGLEDNVRKVNVPTKIENMLSIISIAAVSNHSLFLDSDGIVWATGNNYRGQLGIGDNISREMPTKIEGLPAIIAVETGYDYSLLLDEEGNVWATGRNHLSQLGLGDNVCEVNVPTRIQGLPPIQLPMPEKAKIPTKSARNIVE